MKYSSTAGRTSGLITSNGSLRMYGGNDTGQLGYGEEASTNPNTPVKIELGPQLENKTIAKYDASSHSQAVLTSEGELYAWGDNENGRLGVGHFDRIKTIFQTKLVTKMTSGPIFGIVVVIFMLLKTINFMVLEKTIMIIMD